jgi:hypothetical protein
MLLSSESVSNSLSGSDDSLRRADCPLQDRSLAVLGVQRRDQHQEARARMRATRVHRLPRRIAADMNTTQPDRRRDAERERTGKPPPPEDPHSEEPDFVDEPDLPAGEPSGQPTHRTKPLLPSERKP